MSSEAGTVLAGAGAGAGDSTAADDVHQPSTTASSLDGEFSSSGADTTANDGAGDSSSIIAHGLSSMINSVIRDFDSRAEDTIRSQDQLSSSIDRLTQELDQLLEDAPLPFVMQHAVKISGVRKRVSSLNTLLRSIQRRLDNIDRMVTVGAAQDSARQP